MPSTNKIQLNLAGLLTAAVIVMLLCVHVFSIYPGASSYEETETTITIENGAFNADVYEINKEEFSQIEVLTLANVEEQAEQMEAVAGWAVLLFAVTGAAALIMTGTNFAGTGLDRNTILGAAYVLTALIFIFIIVRYIQAYETMQSTIDLVTNTL
jgi:hypothetical protein